MENNIEVLEQKLVPFNGAELLGVKATDGKVYVGVRWICEGIGLSEGQVKSERKRINEDVVLNQGGRNFILPTHGGRQDVITIDVKYLPLWLAKIPVTPNMLKKQPDVAEKLIHYQLKAADVLSEAFIGKKPSYMILDEEERAERWIEEQREKKRIQKEKLLLEQQVADLQPKLKYLDVILNSKGTVTITQIAKDYALTAQDLNVILKDAGVQYQVNKQWVLKKKYADKGYTQSHSFDFNHKDGTPDVKMNTRWTQRGRLFIHELLTSMDIKPNIEREYSDVN